MSTFNDSAYRRGFIQGIQFAMNSLKESHTPDEIVLAQGFLHLEWRIKHADNIMTPAPMSTNELAAMRDRGWPHSRVRIVANTGQ